MGAAELAAGSNLNSVRAASKTEIRNHSLIDSSHPAENKCAAPRRTETVSISTVEAAGLFAQVIFPEHFAGVCVEGVDSDFRSGTEDNIIHHGRRTQAGFARCAIHR